MTIQRTKGSLSVFSAISFMLIAQFLFVVLEASRYEEMKKVTEIQSRAQVESLFAEYCIPLWEQYHLLACDLDTDYIRVMLNESAEKYALLLFQRFHGGNVWETDSGSRGRYYRCGVC